MKRITKEEFESTLDELVRWGLVEVELDENGDEVYSSTELRIEDLERCEDCGLPLPHSPKQ